MENRVVINSSILNESPAGLGVYAKNVIQELNRFDNYLVLSPVKIDGVNVEKISKYVSPCYGLNLYYLLKLRKMILFTIPFNMYRFLRKQNR